MFPVNRNEMYLASAAGEYEGDLPEPVTRGEKYLVKIIERIDGFENIDPEDIEAAIENYTAEHAMSLQSADSLTVTANGNRYSVVLTVEENHPKLIINEIEQEE